MLPPVDYTGFDLDAGYIEAAQRRHGTHGRFFCADVSAVDLSAEKDSFNLILAGGVLHHVDDERAAKMFALAHDLLKEGGRFVTVDPCFVPEQSAMSRWVVRRDRGRFVRSREHYLKLAGVNFGKVSDTVRHNLLRVPYTQLLLRCVK